MMLAKLVREEVKSKVSNEQELWEDVKSGSKVAYSYLYDSYVDKLYSYGLKIYYDSDVIEDCIHDLFVNVWKYKEKISIKSSLQFYLFISLRRSILNRVKEIRKSSPIEDKESFLSLSSSSVEDEIIAKQMVLEKKQRLQQCINELTKRQKEVIHLRFFENYDYDEISEIMGLSVESAYNLVSKAITNLKRQL
ncbi:MAG: sigma-70 family RNA polymerase sigma factor [Cyclobacteriaceae bacterium]|nr:sigma-70 family RNA polymerase sigma factor [Cyclobacteriaceae bacterium HetDA_MAG_MS6]